ncbi:LCP family protein [Cohnella zeiphila]|uniref:LCP family protein n=1 Tax=Cohnella zeiphila TaxID=2761120 RepID=A0A7X0SQM3_9BACL|nr:LCP family protein [Cohnella zeiphila]MBB6734357.1 LCP family protein [Cohnella zeiphila]
MNQTRAKSKLRRTLRIAGICVGALVILIGSYAGYLYYKADRALGRIAAPPSPSASASASPSAEPSPSASGDNADTQTDNRPMTFLLAGIDSRAGSGGTLNTDVMMLAVLNPADRKMTLLSLPRDMELKPQTLSSHKANYYYAYFYNKDKDTAIANTKEFFGDLFQLPIDHMVLINFDGLRQLVDAVGGLDIDVDMDMKYRDTADGTNIDLRKGQQELDGQQVLDFVRYRKSNEGTQESSDIARNARQQQVLSQMINKLATFQGMTQWGKVLDIAGDSVRTDIPESDLRSWILDFQSMKPETTQILTLDSKWVNPYIVVDENNLRQSIDTLRTEAGLQTNESDLRQLADVIAVEPSSDSPAL